MKIDSKETVETLETWIRNLIDKILSDAYGNDYFYFKNINNESIIKKKIIENLEQRCKNNSSRFPRQIDALLLSESIDILCNPTLYDKHFKKVLARQFPEGYSTLRRFLETILNIRNKLYHSNPISQREYEKVICYSHDIIDAIKEYYKEINLEKEFNVPSIISINDSLGNMIYESQFLKLSRSRPICFHSNNRDNITLYPGDILEINVEVDETFHSDEYSIKWLYLDNSSIFSCKEVLGNGFKLKVEEHHIREQFQIECIVKSDKTWHRFGKHDDMVLLIYKVLPFI